MATLRPYQFHKDSDVPWLGDVPAHWPLIKTKYLFRERSEKGFPNEPLLAATQTKGVVRKEDFEGRTVLALKDLELLKLVRVNDFVISLRSFQGGIEYAHHQGIISPAYTILYALQPQHQPYFAFLFKSQPYLKNLSLHVTGIRQGQNIDYERLSRSLLPLPPPDEQAAIVLYLDHIDRLIRRYIAAKRKLIALLNEQKQAIIQQAVTRGLDPHVRLKPSGVEWLGDVPEHWTVAALRHRYHSELGKMLDTKRIIGNSLVPYVRNVNVQWDRVDTADLAKMDIEPHEYARYTLAEGDLLVCEGGEVGRCAIWRGELALCGFQKAIHRVRCADCARDNTRFLYYCMWSAAKLGVFVADGSENTIAHLTGIKLQRHKFPFPPKHEQDAIVAYLDVNTSGLDSLVSHIQQEIALLREYRTRLIADVVTGKVDVREAAARLPAEEEDDSVGDEEALADETEGDDDGVDAGADSQSIE